MNNQTEVDNLRILSAEDDLKRKTTLAGPIAIDRMAALPDIQMNGKKKWIQECIKAFRGPGRVSFDEFLYYRLYANDLPDDPSSLYIGKKIQEKIHFACNSYSWHSTVDDKLLFHTILQAGECPLPEIKAVFGDYVGEISTWKALKTDEALKQYLRTPDTYPVFAKPIDGMFSLGAMLLEKLVNDHVVLSDGAMVSVENLAQYIRAMSKRGYLFQAPLVPHNGVSTLVGGALITARIMVLLSPEQAPRVSTSTLKIPVTGNDADNFWREGNIIAPIDITSGIVGPAITGTSFDTRIIEKHPDTDLEICGYALPDWDKVKDSVLSASEHFPGIRTQGWDVCFTASGPVLLEMNFGGDLNMHQHAHRRGILDSEFSGHLRACGYKGKLPMPSS